MVESPFMTMAGEQHSLRKKSVSKKTPIAKSPFWEDLGEEFKGFSGDPTYWKYRNKYLKEFADKHGMWLVHTGDNFILLSKDKKGNVDAYTTKNMWDVIHRMREKAKLRWLL